MPYISVNRRLDLEGHDDRIDGLCREIQNHGELNFVLTSIATGFLLQQTNDKPRYQDRQNVLGTLEAVKLEYYRRALAKYEDGAIKKNTDMVEYEILDK